jgi:predicted SprT family Zn-dependent metalloprotease
VSARIDARVRINTRAKKRFGCCIGTPKTGFVIELAAALPAAGHRVCMQTLAHEVLHTCPGCQDHGDRWKAHAARMNAAFGYAIRRTDRPEALGVALPPAVPVYRWRVTCTGCGKSFLRQKSSPLIKTPQRYRCAACGGKLRVEKLC